MMTYSEIKLTVEIDYPYHKLTHNLIKYRSKIVHEF